MSLRKAVFDGEVVGDPPLEQAGQCLGERRVMVKQEDTRGLTGLSRIPDGVHGIPVNKPTRTQCTERLPVDQGEA
jgi:hypothetical protein